MHGADVTCTIIIRCYHPAPCFTYNAHTLAPSSGYDRNLSPFLLNVQNAPTNSTRLSFFSSPSMVRARRDYDFFHDGSAISIRVESRAVKHRSKSLTRDSALTVGGSGETNENL